jgi:hypothetical protein
MNVWLTIIMSLVLAGVASSQVMQSKLGTLLVAVNCSGNNGGGIVFQVRGDRVYIVTARHLVSKCLGDREKVTVEFSSRRGAPVAARALNQTDGALDIAVLSVPTTSTPEGFDLEVLGRSSRLTAGVEVYTLAYPAGRRATLSAFPSKIVSTGEQLIRFQTQDVEPGSSGGMLLDRDRLLVGMIGEYNPPNAVATPIERILRRLEDWDYGPQLTAPSSPVSSDQPGGTVIQTPRPHLRGDEITFDNTIFVMPSGYTRSRSQEGLVLRNSKGIWSESCFIAIKPSAKLRGDFRSALEAELHPPDWQVQLGTIEERRTKYGDPAFTVEGLAKRGNELVHFVQFSVNPDDRYEEVSLNCSTESRSVMQEFGPGLEALLSSLDYVNTRAQRSRR